MSETTTSHPVAVGDTVWSWYDENPVRYGGPETDRPTGFTTLKFTILSGELPERACEPDRVAPATVTIPERDDRLIVAKRPGSEVPYGVPGPWRLTLPGVEYPSWHRIKRDAVTTGLRRLAILDWHARAAAQASAQIPDGGQPAPVTTAADPGGAVTGRTGGE